MAECEDEHGQYDPDAGSPHPLDPDEAGYEPCNAVLKYTFSRYGERRYCTAMAVSNFGDAANYDEPDLCKHHQSRADLMRQHADNFKTGAYAKSYRSIYQHVEPHKALLANDMYESLVEQSSHNFDAENVEVAIDVSDAEFAPDVDTLVFDMPVPTANQQACKALWYAALDFVVMENIREEQFRVAAEETFDPMDGAERDLAVGEATTVVGVAEPEDGPPQPIHDVEEHHLNIALSRIQKDYKEHLKFGGVDPEPDGDSTDLSGREWVVSVQQPDEGLEPEAADDPETPLDDIEVPEPDQ